MLVISVTRSTRPSIASSMASLVRSGAMPSRRVAPTEATTTPTTSPGWAQQAVKRRRIHPGDVVVGTVGDYFAPPTFCRAALHGSPAPRRATAEDAEVDSVLPRVHPGLSAPG